MPSVFKTFISLFKRKVQKNIQDICPPIPPYSKYFSLDDGELWFESVPRNDDDIDWILVQPNIVGPSMRFIVASVAVEEWHKEAIKWGTLPVNNCKNFDAIANYKTEADRNMVAWREWGNS